MNHLCRAVSAGLFSGISITASAQTWIAAKLVEAHKDTCYADCPPFPMPDSYTYCFQAADQLIIGEHQSWAFGLKQLAQQEGKNLKLHYDNKHLWVEMPNHSQVRLSQEYHEYGFKDPSCRAAAQMRSFQHGYTRPEPVPGEPAIPVMHGSLVYGWSLCRPTSSSTQFECTVWDLDGNVRQQDPFQIIDGGKPSAWDPNVEGKFTVLHLRDGRTLKLTSDRIARR